MRSTNPVNDKRKTTITNKRSDVCTVFDLLAKLESNRSIIFYFNKMSG